MSDPNQQRESATLMLRISLDGTRIFFEADDPEMKAKIKHEMTLATPVSEIGTAYADVLREAYTAVRKAIDDVAVI